jgi:UDP-N-acetylglucosamine 2-epimerase (non-hydrolysing)
MKHGAYVVVTLHRPSNVGDAEQLRAILSGRAFVNAEMRVVFPIHPRTRQKALDFGLGDLLSQLLVLDPLRYRDMLALVDGAAVVMTDSGGLQEETTVLGIPCVTIREATERPITISEGTNQLVGWPPTPKTLGAAFESAVATGRIAVGARHPEGWDGLAAERIVNSLAEENT